MSNPLAGHPTWRQLLIVSVALPLVAVAAILAFAWPAARIAPRDLPVGAIGAGAGTEQLVAGVSRAEPGAFDFRLYPDEAAARQAIEHRDVYGAFAVTPSRVEVLEASAASPAVAEVLTAAGQNIAAQASRQSAAVSRPTVVVSDVVPLAATDPRGAVLAAALLPLSLCSVLIAAGIGLLVRFRPAWRQLLALVTVSSVAGAGVYLVAQGWLGALPHNGAATWAGLTLTVLAIGTTVVGTLALAGSAGFGVAAAVVVFVGNAFSGVSSAPDLLPGAVADIGRWLPPGAGANLLRSTAYFGGHGATGHLTVLIVWIVLGAGAIIVGHRSPIRFAASTASDPEPVAPGQVRLLDAAVDHEPPRHLSVDRTLVSS